VEGAQGSAQFGQPGQVPNPAQGQNANPNNNAANQGQGGGSAAAGAATGDINLTVLNFALTIENLESQFYTEALTVMTVEVMQQAGLSAFQATAISQQIAQTVVDEGTHVQIIQQTIQALGGTPNSACSFNFGSVLSDPITFLSTARSLELAGVGAYIGGAALLNNAQVLGAAATILPIESRHSTAFNLFSGGSLSPQAFEIGMTPQQVLALAGGFLQGCTAQDLGLTANQPLSVIDGLTQSTLFTTGSVLQFQTSASIPEVQGNGLSCQMLAGGATTAIVLPASSCVVPPNINGPVAVFLTSDANPLSGNIATQNADNVLAGPAIIFADINQGEVFQQVFALNDLNLRSLPTANLAVAALVPQGTANSLNSIGGFESQIGVAAQPGAFSGLGFSRSFVDVSYGAMPRSVVQGATQLKTVNGGQRNIAVGGGVGAFVKGWLPQNNPPANPATKRRLSWSRE
jgi:hypothetical protein